MMMMRDRAVIGAGIGSMGVAAAMIAGAFERATEAFDDMTFSLNRRDRYGKVRKVPFEHLIDHAPNDRRRKVKDARKQNVRRQIAAKVAKRQRYA